MAMLTRVVQGLLVALLLPAMSTSQELGKFDSSLDQTRSVRCVIGTEKPDWTKDSGTVIHVRVENTSSRKMELDVFPVLYLKAKQINRSFNERYAEFWAPADLKRDAPAPIHVDSKGGGVSITPKRQSLELSPNAELEFTLHASNLKWANRMSSAWPSNSLFRSIPSGEYEVSLGLGDVACANSVTINPQPQKSDSVEQ